MTAGEKKIKSGMPLMKYDLKVKCKDPVKDAAEDPLPRPQKDLSWWLTDDSLKAKGFYESEDIVPGSWLSQSREESWTWLCGHATNLNSMYRDLSMLQIQFYW